MSAELNGTQLTFKVYRRANKLTVKSTYKATILLALRAKPRINMTTAATRPLDVRLAETIYLGI